MNRTQKAKLSSQKAMSNATHSADFGGHGLMKTGIQIGSTSRLTGNLGVSSMLTGPITMDEKRSYSVSSHLIP